MSRLKERILRRINDTNQIMMAYAIAAALSCVLMPSGTGLAEAIGFGKIDLPIYSWISALENVAPFYRDYFALTWMLFPVWLVAFGIVYFKNYSSENVNTNILMVASLVTVGLLALLLFSDMKIGEGNDVWRQHVVAMAARNRFLGAFVFGGVMTFTFVLAAFALVKTPIDVIRNLSR